MGTSNSITQDEGTNNQISNQKPEIRRLSPKKIIVKSNGEVLRQPDFALLKKSSLNSSQVTKPSVHYNKHEVSFSGSEIYNNNGSQKENGSNIESEKQNPLSSSVSISVKESSQILKENQSYVNSLWEFVVKQSTNDPQMSFEQFSLLVLSTIQGINMKFLGKIKKGEIYPIFSDTNQQPQKFTKDLQIFQITLKNRLYKYFSVSKKHPNHLGVEKYQNQVKEVIEKFGSTIICELMGKTSIWRSLMLLREEQQQKIMEMLEKEGIDQKHLKAITEAEIV